MKTIRDITGHKRSQHGIARAIDRLNEAQRIGRMGDWEYDPASQAISWSPQVFEILGRDPALGPPRDFAENAALYDASSRPLLADQVERAITSSRSKTSVSCRALPVR